MIEVLDIKRLPQGALVVIHFGGEATQKETERATQQIRGHADSLAREDVRFLLVNDGGQPERLWGLYCRWHDVWMERRDGSFATFKAPELAAVAVNQWVKTGVVPEGHTWAVTEFGRQERKDINDALAGEEVCPLLQ